MRLRTSLCGSGQACAAPDKPVRLRTSLCGTGQACAAPDKPVRHRTSLCGTGQACAAPDKPVRHRTSMCGTGQACAAPDKPVRHRTSLCGTNCCNLSELKELQLSSFSSALSLNSRHFMLLTVFRVTVYHYEYYLYLVLNHWSHGNLHS